MKPRKKEENLIGVLALAADEKQLLEGCLTTEEFALFLESKLSEAEQQRCLEHLSQCDSCYSEWKLLKGSPAFRRRKNIIPFLRVKSYKYVGSTLAVAATIVVFLNVYQPPTIEMTPTDYDTTIIESQSFSESESLMDSVEEPSSASVEQRREEKVAAPKASKYMQKTKSRGKAEPKDKEILAPAPVMEKTMSKPESVAVKRSLQLKSLKQEVRPGGYDFSAMLYKGCAQNEYNPDYWVMVATMGENLIGNSRTESFSTEKNVRIMELIAAMEDGTWQQQCDEILGLLAEELKSR